MASFKDTFEAKHFAANSFACGLFRGAAPLEITQAYVTISDRTKYDLAVSSAVKWMTEAISGVYDRAKHDLAASSAAKWVLSIFDRNKHDLTDSDSGDPYG